MRAVLEHPHHLRTLLSADGTLIVYAVVGDGPRDFVLAPGLGAPMSAYHFLFERFAGEFRFITWEPRGLFRSAVPEGGLAALRLENHVADLEAIAAREGARRFVLGGWSMGVQISLEYARRHPESVAALVLINGSCGHLLRGVALLGRRPRALRALVRAAAAAGPVLARDGNLDDLQALVSEFKHLEFGRYLSMMLALDEHTCESYLHEIDIPALVTAGRRDLMTPPALGEALARRLPRGELFTFEQGTHYSLVEEPEALNRTLAPFLSRALGGENRCSSRGCHRDLSPD